MEAIRQHVIELGGVFPQSVADIADGISRTGGTPLVVSSDANVLGVIHLKDIVKGGMRERFAQMRVMGIRTVMITGDNPLTAAPSQPKRVLTTSSRRQHPATNWI